MAAASAGPRSGSPTAALVAGSIRTTVPEARTQTTPSATVMLPAPERGMTAANRPRSKAGTVAPAGVGGGWVDLEVLEVPAMSVHAAVSSTATTSAWCQRGTRGGDGRSLAGVGMAHLADPPVERLDPADVLFQGWEADAGPPVGVEDLDQPASEPTHQLQQLALDLLGVSVVLRCREEGLVLLGQRQELPA